MKISIIIFISLMFSMCKSDITKIDTVALVVPKEYKGNIVIFFEQDTTVGDIRLINNKHFFFVKEDGVFFTKLPLGDGFMEDYIELNNKLIEVNYSSPMTLNQASDTSFQVVGGTYRRFKEKNYKNGNKFLKFLPFKSGFAGDLKGNWENNDSVIRNIYASKLKEFPPS